MVSRADGSSFKGPDNGDAILGSLHVMLALNGDPRHQSEIIRELCHKHDSFVGLDVVVTTLHKVPLDEEALFCKSYSPQGDFGAALFR